MNEVQSDRKGFNIFIRKGRRYIKGFIEMVSGRGIQEINVK
jgi:hypothetical protein